MVKTRTPATASVPQATPATTSPTTLASEAAICLAPTASATAPNTTPGLRTSRVVPPKGIPRSQAPRPAAPPTNNNYRRSTGEAGERAVRDWLEVRGLRVLGSNVRVGHWEVDLLVQDGRTLVLVEVRVR